MDPDFLMIQKMKRGDEQAVEEFVLKYYPMILKYCLVHVGDFGYAEDATQETFERFFRNFNRYRHYGKAANYLYVIAGNVCKDYYGTKQEMASGTAEDILGEVKPYTNTMADLELQMDLYRAFSKLPPEIREVAILFFCQEMKQREIARVLGIGVPLVKYRIKRAREILRSWIKEESILRSRLSPEEAPIVRHKRLSGVVSSNL